MKTVNEIHDYWKNPDDGKNDPVNYLKNGSSRTDFLINKIKNLQGVSKQSSILEIGCNAGRNLDGLFQNGYNNLTGIEISKNAVDTMIRILPDLYSSAKIFNEPAEIALKKIPDKSVDIIYTMAVLVHIHDESAGLIFQEMKRISKKYIITIEDERKISDRHFKRDYKNVFCGMGLNQIEFCRMKKYSDLSKNYYYRLFEVPEG